MRHNLRRAHYTVLVASIDCWLDMAKNLHDEHVAAMNDASAKKNYARVAEIGHEMSNDASNIASMTFLYEYAEGVLKGEFIKDASYGKKVSMDDVYIKRNGVSVPLLGALEMYVDMTVSSVDEPIPVCEEGKTRLTLGDVEVYNIHKAVRENGERILAGAELIAILQRIGDGQR